MPTPEDLRDLIEKATSPSALLHCEVQLRDFMEAHAEHFLALWEKSQTAFNSSDVKDWHALGIALAALKEAP